MEDAALWGILATVFGVLIAGIVELVKSFKDGAVTRAIKGDTTDMKPKVDDIKVSVGRTNEILLDAIKPTMQSVSEQTRKIDTVVSSMTRFECLVQGSKANEIRPDVLMAQMMAVYDERSKLILENQELKKEIEQLQKEKLSLAQQIDEMEPEPPERRNVRGR